ncbi:MAG: hypothetical protein L0L25_06005 [Enterococcus sp.]|nr:hypothetical protein [Enterococcus sp.]
MFRELFLTRQQQKKIHFFQLMEGYPAGEYSVQSLSQQLDCSYQSFFKHVAGDQRHTPCHSRRAPVH